MALEKLLSLPRGTLISSEEYKSIAGQIRLNPMATPEMIQNLKAVPEGEKPMDLIFAIKYEYSANYRKYTTNAYRNVVEQILKTDVFIPVHYGHQNPETAAFDARDIVGSVIGAYLDEGAGIIYYRIIPDASKKCEDIRRWLRNRQINALSIWGFTSTENVKDGIEIVDDFFLLSVDLVPPFCEGQENVGLVISEKNKGDEPGRIAQNMDKTNIDKGENMVDLQLKDVSNSQLTGEMSSRLKDGRMSVKRVLGEMEGAGLASSDELSQMVAQVQELAKETEAYLKRVQDAGFKDFDELLSFAIDAKKKETEKQEQADFEKTKKEAMESKGLIDKEGKPTGAMAGFVEKWAGLKVGMNISEMLGAIDKVITDKDIIKMAGESAGGEPHNVGSQGSPVANAEEVYSI